MDNIRRSTAFMTHNGLKVRLNHDFCAQYMDEENILAWYISIEAFDSLRVVLSIITAIVIMFMHEDPIYSGVIISVMYFIGYIISQSYFQMVLWNWIYGSFYMLYSLLDRFFIPYIALVVIGIITKEYYILLSFIIARMVCFIVLFIINNKIARYYHKKYGIYLGDVERTAIKLIQFYSDKDITFDKWIKEYLRFMKKQVSY